MANPIQSYREMYYRLTGSNHYPQGTEQAVNDIFYKLVEKSDAFKAKHPFPLETNRMKELAKQVAKRDIVEHAIHTRPIIHEELLPLFEDFLRVKKEHGTDIEKKIYAGMDVKGLVDRLIKKRPISFVGSTDFYKPRGLDEQIIAHEEFTKIGTDSESRPLVMNDYMSYDEMQLSACMIVSTPTFFINNGNEDNEGEVGESGTFEPKGVYVAMVGARFEKMEKMEWQHMAITPGQNRPEKGYGANGVQTELQKIWARFYEQGDDVSSFFPSFNEAGKDKTGKYIKRENDGTYFNGSVYKKRIRMSIEAFLREANQRGRDSSKKVFVVAEGIGLGCWSYDDNQERLMLEVYRDLMRDNKYEFISTINLSRLSDDLKSLERNWRKIGGDLIESSIKVAFTDRNPADKLNTGELLVTSYAWDSNSFPGNEYWNGALSSSADPAAASCSQIAELQNPEINPQIAGDNIHIAGSNSVVKLN